MNRHELHRRYEALRELNLHSKSLVCASISLMDWAKLMADVLPDARPAFLNFLEGFDELITKSGVLEYEQDIRTLIFAADAQELPMQQVVNQMGRAA